VSQPAAEGRGVACLANDGVVDWLIALCESLHRHNPGLPLTVIPFDDRLARTRATLDRFGYDLFEGPALAAVKRLGADYWPNDEFKASAMRKFCAWETYDTFLFLDADIVVLRPLDPYFDAIDTADADFLYFATDLVQVYRPGALRERMLAEHRTAGFNSGTFMARRDSLSLDTLGPLAAAAAPLRSEFVDNLEQTFVNYVVDVSGIKKADANELVTDLAVAGGLMRIVRSGADFVLADRRVPYSGRLVSMIHWGGYKIGPLLPHRQLFLRYRLAAESRLGGLRYRLEVAFALLKDGSPRRAYHAVRHWRFRAHNWLSARGLAQWQGTGD